MRATGDLPSLSVRRPLLMMVANLMIILAGLAALAAVEVRELPDVDRPIVTVRANFPGASPETVDAEATSLVEGAIARVSGVTEIRSSSEEDNFRIRTVFQPNIDLDAAATEVREAVSQIERDLPEAIEQLTVVKADQDSDPVIQIAVESPTLPMEQMTRIIEQSIVPRLISVDGVADVELEGKRQRMLRVVADPLRLTSYGLSVTDLARVLDQAPFDIPVGSFRSDDQELIVRADASVATARQIEEIVIRDPVRVGDVAYVFFGPEDAASYVRLDGEPVIALGIIRKARSNTISISDAVQREVTSINADHDRLKLTITEDRATFIRGSVAEVLRTLVIATLIVVSTICLFTASLRATLIPAAAIPVSLIGTLAAIWLMGFSVNILTLLALVLATGLIVDDAIVVLENIQRRRSEGLAARAAAVLGTREVFFAVIATTAVLISVFVPISFLPSTAGRLFREFGLVLAVAVGISSFVALTAVPALAVGLGDKDAQGQTFGPLCWIGHLFGRGYRAILGVALAFPLAITIVAVGFAGSAALLYPELPEELLPPEDRGLVQVLGTGPDGVGLTYSERQAQAMEAVLAPLRESGEVASVLTIVGRWDLNRVFISAPLASWEARDRSQQEIMRAIRRPMSEIPGSQLRVFTPNSLNLRRAGGGVEVAILGSDYQEMFAVSQQLARAIEESGDGLSDPRISYQPTQPQLAVRIDRRRAADLGVPLDGLATTLRAMIDGDELADLTVGDETIPILLEAGTGTINDPGDLVNLHVMSDHGRLIPLTTLVTIEEEGVAAELDRHAQRRAIEIDVDREAVLPLREAIDRIRGLADDILPPDMTLLLLGEAATLDETSNEVALTYALALVVVFLVLVAQFESITSALVVTLTVPFGLAAAVLALAATGTTVNIYSQIGLVMLIGLMAKNGILLVEFADQMRDRGMSVREAIETSARVRLRPVAMTLISTVVGGLPLILSTGPGAEARAAIGWVVFGGLGFAAGFTLILTPVFYLALARFSKPRAAETDRLDAELAAAEAMPVALAGAGDD